MNPIVSKQRRASHPTMALVRWLNRARSSAHTRARQTARNVCPPGITPKKQPRSKY